MNRLILYLFICVINLGMYCNVHASDSIPGDYKIHSLNGHRFSPCFDYHSPFIFTGVRMGLGIGQTEDVEYFALRVGDYELLTLTGNIIFSDMNVKYQQRIKDWLALFLGYHFTARVGTQFSSLFVEGINTVNEFEIGWLIRLYKSEKHILSTHYNIYNAEANFIDFRNTLSKLQEDSLVAVSQNIPSLIGAAGIRYNYAPSKLIGIGILAEIGYGEALTRKKTKIFYKLSPKLDIDLSSRTRIPLGIMLNYFLTSAPAAAQVKETKTQLFRLKLSYLGANDFILGISTAFGLFPVQSSDRELKAFFGSLEMNYYF